MIYTRLESATAAKTKYALSPPHFTSHTIVASLFPSSVSSQRFQRAGLLACGWCFIYGTVIVCVCRGICLRTAYRKRFSANCHASSKVPTAHCSMWMTPCVGWMLIGWQVGQCCAKKLSTAKEGFLMFLCVFISAIFFLIIRTRL